ncbi:acyl-CoA reductase [Salegentibacter sediminis]|uniref:acyl-CoA reductase n=1 Tax=Salegentibacter sediminis TaxID=1930251 RepID=UPI0009BDD40E|nr:acyl-CoA reductase [Salegentibacter sediminis]
MTIDDRKAHFIKLGDFLANFEINPQKKPEIQNDYLEIYKELNEKIDAAIHYNGWFTRENVVFSLQQWSEALTRKNLDQWLDRYDFSAIQPRTVGIVMAGNIPLVGFHDFLSVLLAGHKVVAKLSGNDKQLMPVLARFLIQLDPEYKNRISFTENGLENFDAVIATGSNNTARYFEYYFSKVPSIIRKNRNSVAILTGNETPEELEALGEDIFRYYGLGCRNVSKLYVPKNYNFDDFFKAMYKWNPIINQAKYANNYDYNKAVYLMSNFKLLENGFLILKEDSGYSSPIATVFYETYVKSELLREKLKDESEKIQCIVKKDPDDNEVKFGHTQKPQLWDYADNVDTMEFLLKI